MIQWYPGHMEKARRDMLDAIKAVDLIVEIRDARIPAASANPLLDGMGQGKPRLILLSKADLADDAQTIQWERALKREDRMVKALDIAHDPHAKKEMLALLHVLGEPKIERMKRRGICPRPLRALVCGIPNSGKSTLINRISKKNSARTENRPGVTRSLSWIHADPSMDLLDTPGVLWPRFDNPRMGSLLAATGAISETILNLPDVAMDTIHIIRSFYPGVLEAAYDTPANIRTDHMLEAIALKRHAIKENNTPDSARAAGIFIHEFRSGSLGRFTLERPYAEDMQQ